METSLLLQNSSNSFVLSSFCFTLTDYGLFYNVIHFFAFMMLATYFTLLLILYFLFVRDFLSLLQNFGCCVLMDISCFHDLMTDWLSLIRVFCYILPSYVRGNNFRIVMVLLHSHTWLGFFGYSGTLTFWPLKFVLK